MLIGLLIVVVLLVVALLIALPHAAPHAIAWQLRALGLDQSAVERAEIGTSEVALERLRLAPGLSARRVTLAYAPMDLIRGRLGELRIDGLRVEARLGPTGELEVAGLELEGQDGDGGPPLPLLPEAILIDDALVVIALPEGEAKIEGALRLDVVRGGPDRFEIQATRIGAAADGLTFAASLTAAGTIEPFANNLLETLEARASGSFEADDIHLPGFGAGALTGALELSVGDGLARLTLPQATARLALLEQSRLLDPLGGEGPVEVAVAPGESATVTLDLEDRTGSLSLPVRVAAGRPSADLVLDTRFDAAKGIERIVLDDLALEAEARDLFAGPRVEHLRLELRGQGTPLQASLSGRLTLQAAGGVGPVTVRELALALPVAIEVEPDRIEVALPDPGALDLDGLQLADAGARGRLRLGLPAASVLELERAPDLPWRLDLPLRVEQLEGALAGARIQGGAGQIQVEATGRAAKPGPVTVRLADGALTLPDPAVALRGLAAQVPLRLDGPAPGPITFGVQDVRSLASPPLFSPFRADGVVRPEPDRMRFAATLARTGVELEVEGYHRLDRAEGRASIELQPVRFEVGGLQPADLVPLAAGLAERVTGVVSLSGEVVLDSPDLASDLQLTLQDLGLVIGPVQIGAVDGSVVIDQLEPVSTAADQRLSIGLLDFGLAFTDGRVRFELVPGGPLEVRRLRFEWAGGQIVARPFTVGSADDVISVTLEARGLDLDLIFGQVKLPGLKGKGTIDGVLPVRIEGGEASIERGRLVARRAGWLRYRPEDPPDALVAGGESMALLLQALENFRYDELEITLDGRTDRAMDIGLHLKGANPELYDGHPVEFNLNLEGELANILRQGLRSYTLPDRVREQIERSTGR